MPLDTVSTVSLAVMLFSYEERGPGVVVSDWVELHNSPQNGLSSLSFSFCCNLFGYFKQAMNSDCYFFSVPFSMAGKGMRLKRKIERFVRKIALL